MSTFDDDDVDVYEDRLGCTVPFVKWFFSTLFGACAGGILQVAVYLVAYRTIMSWSSAGMNLMHVFAGGAGAAVYTFWFINMGNRVTSGRQVSAVFLFFFMVGVGLIGFIAILAGPGKIASVILQEVARIQAEMSHLGP